MTVFVLGLDVGFATFGWCLVELLPDGERVEAMGVITTKKSNAKQNVLAASDEHRRALQLAGSLAQVAIPTPDVVCAEAKSAPRNASAAAKIMRAWGIVDSYVWRNQISLVQASPQQIKKAVCGNVKKPSKLDVQDALIRRYCGDNPAHRQSVERYCGMDRFVCETPRTLHEHAFDALGAVVACLDSEVIRAIRPRAWVEQVSREGRELRDSIAEKNAATQRTPGMLTRGGVS